MTVYTYSEARQHLAELLEKAHEDGEVRIKRKDGQVFIIKPDRKKSSPLNVKGLNIDVSREEILDFIAEGRQL